MNRGYLLTRAHWCDGIAWQAMCAGKLMRRLFAELSDDVADLIESVREADLGRGIVGTPADFGRLGERPTHPDLLDWMAVEFADSGWSLKRFHRMLLLSTAWRQASMRASAS